MSKFKIKSDFKPAGDQPEAIKELVDGFNKGLEKQTLLGVTGSGKTFTIANVIEKIQKPTLVIAHNKTLAAQLAQEFRDFFPNNAVHYFVSYYDYYQPEAYVSVSDTYIEKEAQINAEIERLRHASTQALLTRRDVIIVASVSCIYGLGSPLEYKKVNVLIKIGDKVSRDDLIRKLIGIYFERTNADLEPGKIRAVGNFLEIMPVNEKVIYRISFENRAVSHITIIDAISRSIKGEEKSIFVFPARHYVTPEKERERATKDIKAELAIQLAKFEKEKKLLEADRLKRRTNYDLAMIKEIGYCNGIENYSRHFDGRSEGEPPYTLMSYFPHTKSGKPDFLTVIDESHVTIPQISGMQAGDASRKNSLIEFGFRLPSAKDNRPLIFNEFEERVGQSIYTSATPGSFEKKYSQKIVKQIVRPTGLLDPELEVRGVISKGEYKGQIKDFITETEKVVKRGGRVLGTTLTKKMAEDLSLYLKEKGIKAEYLHSEIMTIDRIIILTDFRKGEFDCLIGVNLLREGLDLPEVEFIGIFDADKEGFLRSETSLIQTIGRAARNVLGKVVLYADTITGSLKRAMDETNRRRLVQIEYNKKHKITPKTIVKKIHDITASMKSEQEKAVATLLAIEYDIYKKAPQKFITQKRKQMMEAVAKLDFETAALIRDEMALLQDKTSNEVKKLSTKWKKERK
ncbi:MAG: excinuclease ABC subunit UvrB [Patescibacteria group bacterium]